MVTWILIPGSYHQHSGNTAWRHYLLKAAMHPDCLDPPTDKDLSSNQETTCNVCGLELGGSMNGHCESSLAEIQNSLS